MPRQHNRASAQSEVSLGIAAHLGWASVVTIVVTPDLFRVLRTDRLALVEAGEPEALEPYHRAAGFVDNARGAPPPDPAALLEHGLEAQRRQAVSALARLTRELGEAGYRIATAAILTGRGRLATSLEKVLASHAQIHVAEGLAVRAALRRAFARLGIRTAAIEQQTAFAQACAVLRLDERSLASRLKSLRPEITGQWRQEERLAALAARVASSVAAEN